MVVILSRKCPSAFVEGRFANGKSCSFSVVRKSSCFPSGGGVFGRLSQLPAGSPPPSVVGTVVPPRLGLSAAEEQLPVCALESPTGVPLRGCVWHGLLVSGVWKLPCDGRLFLVSPVRGSFSSSATPGGLQAAFLLGTSSRLSLSFWVPRAQLSDLLSLALRPLRPGLFCGAVRGGRMLLLDLWPLPVPPAPLPCTLLGLHLSVRPFFGNFYFLAEILGFFFSSRRMRKCF